MNDHFNDVKLTALNFQNGNITDHIDDAEVEYLKNLIVNPNPKAQINDLWNEMWDELGVEAGQFNNRAEDYILNYAGVLPESPDMNGLWLAYWESLQP